VAQLFNNVTVFANNQKYVVWCRSYCTSE